ncbi:membrane bound O-acyl transferase family-domain-containing protein [Phanerochaete sordida]|uniref:Membrane bound O-acyl transferase family-domain-containing protein n=1 Tax=Phanerochaete sordida TaxID=48140 RepID=A0A9P3GLE0_9APHY|nr:membrane bound O-acyl transferase family-domain-containing protein [Phanerochaete sordida]
MSAYLSGIETGNACLRAALLLLATDPVRACRHEAQTEEPARMSCARRLAWTLRLTCAYRGVGWSCQIAHLPPRPTSTRSGFVASRLFRIALHALCLDVVHSYMSVDPLFSGTRAAADAQRQRRPALFVFASALALAHFYATFNIAYDATALAAVATRCSAPAAWPAAFGRWADAYTVRRFWGRTWHQQLRWLLGGLGAALARALGCARGSWASAHVQLGAAFALSGAAHACGDAVLALPGASARFFLAQAAVITLEDALVAGGARLGVPDAPAVRVCGFVWTAAWMLWSNAWLGLAGPQLRAGYLGEQVATVSVVRPVLRYVAAATGMDVLKSIETLIQGA